MAKREVLGSKGTWKISTASTKEAEYKAIIREHNNIFKKGKGAEYYGISHDDSWKDNP
jgi:hypothetical protein